MSCTDTKNCVVQTVHAAFDYYPVKKSGAMYPWYDNVAVQSPEPQSTWYAQLRLLFYWGETKLAMVRRYEVVTEPDILTKFGCVRLKWEDAGASGQPH